MDKGSAAANVCCLLLSKGVHIRCLKTHAMDANSPYKQIT